MNKQTQNFLDKFQTFEDLLKKRTNSDDRTHLNDALEKARSNNLFITQNYFIIQDIIALRNIFSHRGRGNYIANINSVVLKSLDRIIQELNNPPTVISKFKTNIYEVKTDENIAYVMKNMHDNMYTQVPVWKGNNFIGVFSYTSFFDWLADRQKVEDVPTFTKKWMGDISRKYLNPPCVNYSFISESDDLYTIPPMFEKTTRNYERLDCLFITPNGKKGEKITGIITSWDLSKIK